MTQTSDIPILEQGDGWIVVNKPAGLETIVKGGGNTRFCLTSIVRRQLKAEFLAPCHRLDRDTTGCLLMSTQKNITKTLEDRFRQKQVEKTYLALCLGRPRNPSGTINRPLSKWSGGQRPVRVIKGGQGLPASTGYRLLATCRALPGITKGISLIAFQPKTGRTHQIRVHAEALGYPILGDHQYGDRPINRIIKEKTDLKRQALHAWKVSLPGLKEKEMIKAAAPLPADMQQVLEEMLPEGLPALEKER